MQVSRDSNHLNSKWLQAEVSEPSRLETAVYLPLSPARPPEVSGNVPRSSSLIPP